ncbi:MAG TPA: tRNA 2-selenouridine(34) synthase MnmH [Burkholderiales bacterium]|jgi:tRNA 2-selenouridine synthase|nr:tRNA 2-selenouridine(34) synthase MnmH [Burkholderiales bacterium]
MTQDLATVAQLQEFDEIVDVRSPAEFALDHVPAAINCPVLDDAERARIGTMYVRESPFKAKKIGAALVARNIARHVEERFVERPKSWRPLIYCWRGGQRSAAMTIVLRQIGWDARRLAGGYKAYRRHVVAETERLAATLSLRVVCGPTGSGKSALLRALRAAGAQVLDLERLAEHRGSVLGDIPGQPQPSQKMFESRVWHELSRLDPQRPVFVEAESRKIGDLRVPESLLARMWTADCVLVEASSRARVALLLREYAHFTRDLDALNAKLDCLTALHGRERIARWKALAASGNWPAFLAEVLSDHYDPAYRRSTLAHYPRLAQARVVRIAAGSPEEYGAAAAALLGTPVAHAAHEAL